MSFGTELASEVQEIRLAFEVVLRDLAVAPSGASFNYEREYCNKLGDFQDRLGAAATEIIQRTQSQAR